MNTPSISFSFSFIKDLTQGFRIFLIASITGTYALVLYELFPEFLFNPNYVISYFLVPIAILAGVLIGLPKFMNKTSKPKVSESVITEEKSGDDLLNEIIAGDGKAQQITADPQTQQTVQQDSTGMMTGNSEGVTLDPAAVGGANAELEALLASDNSTPTDPGTITADTSNASGLNEGVIHDMIDQKFEPVEKDLSSFKKDLNKIKEDMKITKENVDSLTESFEGTLTDMKAFQAEIANPLNFMRKYFESIDIKSLSDPSLPLKQMTSDVTQSQQALPQQSVVSSHAPDPSYSQPTNIPTTPQSTQEVPTNTIPEPVPKDSEMETIEKGTDLDNPMDSVMKPLFSGNLSVSNLMSIVELAGEMLKENGDDCIELLIEQCKLMGLKDEDENTIYNIIDMLKKSGMNVEDTLIQLYKFAKIVGINDKEADTHYSKLLVSKKEASDEKSGDEE
jgi:hypothetical protein